MQSLLTIASWLTGSVIIVFARFVTAVRGIWQGAEPDQTQRIFFANHCSHGDFVLLWTVLPAQIRKRTRPVAGADYWLASGLRRFIGCKVFNSVLIERRAGERAVKMRKQAQDLPDQVKTDQVKTDQIKTDQVKTDQIKTDQINKDLVKSAQGKPEQSQVDKGKTGQSKPSQSTSDPISQMLEALDAGDSLIVFPEGTRNTTSATLLPFKSGLYRVASERPDIELVPVWISNLNRVLPKGEIIPVPLACTVTFGEPVLLKPDENKNTFIQRAETALRVLAPGDFDDE